MRRPWERIPPKLVQREPCHSRRLSLALVLEYGDMEKRSNSPERSMQKMSWTWILRVSYVCRWISNPCLELDIVSVPV